jgi:hypothetical protein
MARRKTVRVLLLRWPAAAGAAAGVLCDVVLSLQQQQLPAVSPSAL